MEVSEEKQPPLVFGQRLRREREKRHISQEKFADMVGCDVRSIRRWEQGKSLPDYENRHRLSQTLGMDLEALNQLFQPTEEVNTTLTVEHVPDNEPSILNTSSEAQSDLPKYPVQRRRLLSILGGIGLAATVGGSGLMYWFSHSQSSAHSQPPSPLLYTYHTPSGKGIDDVEWSPQGTYIACVDDHHTTQIITALAGTYHLSRSSDSQALNCLAWSPDGTQLTSPSPDQTIRVWDPVNGVDALRFPYPAAIMLKNSKWLPESIAWSPDGKCIAISGNDGFFGLWNAKTGQQLQTYQGHTGIVWWVAWSPDNMRLASAGADGTVRIWDATTGETLLTYTGHTQTVMDVQWSPSGKKIVSASEDKTVHIWDPNTGKTSLIYRGHLASVQAAEWSPDERSIASGGVDTTIQVWNALTGTRSATYHSHTNTVWTLSWSPDGQRLASSSADGTLRIWQIGTGK